MVRTTKRPNFLIIWAAILWTWFGLCHIELRSLFVSTYTPVGTWIFHLLISDWAIADSDKITRPVVISCAWNSVEKDAICLYINITHVLHEYIWMKERIHFHRIIICISLFFCLLHGIRSAKKDLCLYPWLTPPPPLLPLYPYLPPLISSIKLNHDNFLLWIAQIISYLKGQNLFGFLDGTTFTLPYFLKNFNKPNPSFTTWQ